MNKEVIYIGDPMCSWCYGFAAAIRGLREAFAQQATFRLVMGGLRPDGTHVADKHYTAFLREHWTDVQNRTGQPFSLTILDKTGWIYDTEKACRAVVVMRQLKPEAEWDYFAAAQKSFYFHNHDPNNPESFARIGEEFGVDAGNFLTAYRGDKAISATQEDFHWARSVGVSSFPTVLVKDYRGLAALTVGYRPLDMLKPVLAQWIEEPAASS